MTDAKAEALAQEIVDRFWKSQGWIDGHHCTDATELRSLVIEVLTAQPEPETTGELPEWWVQDRQHVEIPFEFRNKIEAALHEHAERGRLLRAVVDSYGQHGPHELKAIEAARKHLDAD